MVALRSGTLLLAGVVAVSLLGTAPAAAAAPGTAPAASTQAYYQAAVNLIDAEAPGASGFVGSVSFTLEAGRTPTADVYLSRAETVDCADGTEDIAQVTLRTEGAASAPGPVTLDIDRRLRSARGAAVVDLVEETSPGCGGEPTSAVLAAQRVAIDVEGTTVRFRTGMATRASSGRDAVALRSVDFARDGVGTVTVGDRVAGAESGAAFLKYAIDRTSSRGGTVDLPPNAAPPGGLGALGAFTRSDDAAQVVDDVFVAATIAAPPARTARLDAVAVRSAIVACVDGGTAERIEVVEASGPAAVSIDHRLSRADAAGALPAGRYAFDGCTGVQEEGAATVAVSLRADAVGAAVRSVDDRFQVTPGEGVERERLTFTARPAAGTVAVGAVSGLTDLAAIARAGR